MLTTLVNHPNGAVIAINERKLQRLPFFLTTNAPDAAVTLSAYGAAGPTSMSISGEGTCEVFALGAQKTGVCRVKLSVQDGLERRALSNGGIHINTIFGDGLTPYPLPEPLYVDELRRITAEFVDLSAASNSVRLFGLSRRNLKMKNDPTLELARQRQNPQQFLSLPYFYTFDAGVASVAGNATSEFVITIGPEHHFLLSQISGTSTGLYNINLINVATGESIVNAPQGGNYGISSDLIVGTAGYPFCLKEPILFQINQKILVRITDRTGSTNTIYLTLGGRAIADRLWR